MYSDWEIKIIDKGYKFERDIYIFRRTPQGIELMEAGSNTLTTYSNQEVIPDKPTLSLTPETLQAFANTLDKIGITPKQGYLEGKVESMESHLKDMRTLLKLK